jgi:beta-phosphoglucomutase-like phosphatase (HAD superfamily)
MKHTDDTFAKRVAEAVAAPLRYEIAQAERREAYAELNYAGTLLELRQIRERAAELRSQHEPTATFSGSVPEVREAILRAVHYVITGHKEELE